MQIGQFGRITSPNRQDSRNMRYLEVDWMTKGASRDELTYRTRLELRLRNEIGRMVMSLRLDKIGSSDGICEEITRAGRLDRSTTDRVEWNSSEVPAGRFRASRAAFKRGRERKSVTGRSVGLLSFMTMGGSWGFASAEPANLILSPATGAVQFCQPITAPTNRTHTMPKATGARITLRIFRRLFSTAERRQNASQDGLIARA